MKAAIYTLDCRQLAGREADWLLQVPEGRQARILARAPQDHLPSLGAELLFQYAVSRHRPDLPLPALREEDPLGKPFLPGHPEFHFSLSHSGHWALCAFAPVPVGADLQQVRPVRPGLARRFTAAERRELADLSPEDYNRRLFQLWTLKEAYAKCTGQGLLCPFGSFEAVCPGAGFSSALLEGPEEGYYAALCLKTKSWEALPAEALSPARLAEIF
ncbi:MAG: 4'-phosphopantetheinyl transferase superfamily protein [Oscillospiraceae bacterium]|nr:4'-phosphopantetheinyl transferase superfamily protein [Oscillospiraceae bacterium]